MWPCSSQRNIVAGVRNNIFLSVQDTAHVSYKAQLKGYTVVGLSLQLDIHSFCQYKFWLTSYKLMTKKKYFTDIEIQGLVTHLQYAVNWVKERTLLSWVSSLPKWNSTHKTRNRKDPCVNSSQCALLTADTSTDCASRTMDCVSSATAPMIVCGCGTS